MTLERDRSELREAQRLRDPLAMEAAQRWIQAHYARIRAHCAECGLGRPDDVPAGDE
jgi:hypothetical protein